MSRGGVHFSSEELAQVLSHYDIGVIHQVMPLSAGNKRAPKLIISSEQGRFLLKRRPKGKDDLYRVAFAHAVQNHLAQRGFPLAALLATCDENNTILQLDNHIYEVFEFVTGIRYDGSAEVTTDAGRQLAAFHRHLADFVSEWNPLKGSFHDSTAVRRHLKRAAGTLSRFCKSRTDEAEKTAASDRKLQKITELLMRLYNNSSIRVNELGFDYWPQQVVHGDWHPGNMLFSGGRLVAVVDFDSVRLAAAVTDLANGMLQFSIVGDRPNPADWPDYLDQAKLIQFLNGYQQLIELEKEKLNSLVDLMIETIVAEAILPVAATGFFGNLSGSDFLRMICRKAEWLDNNRNSLAEAICS
jgi:Ser/Thr protein kinase RdoA (MazF antagonist)